MDSFITKYKSVNKNIRNKYEYTCWIRKVFKTKENANACARPNFFNGWNTTLDFIHQRYPMTDSEMQERMKEIPFIPEIGCKQVVLGTMELIAPYFYYNEMLRKQGQEEVFILLASQHWTEELNITYVSCAMGLLLDNHTCMYPIRLLLPKDNYQLLSSNTLKPRVTLYELCILFQYSAYFTTHQMDKEKYSIFLFKPSMKGGKRSTRRSTRRRDH